MGINESTSFYGAGSLRGPATPHTSLADALFANSQQRVLALLFGQPERSFFITELISLAGAGRGAVQREVRRLAESGLITVHQVGNQKHVQANPAAPIFHELHAIVSKTLGPAAVLAEALAPLDEKLWLALLYGSVAKGKDTAYSDIDVLLVSDALTLEDVFATLTPAEQQLGRPISPMLLTIAEFRKRRDTQHPFLTRVLEGGYVVLRGDEDELPAR